MPIKTIFGIFVVASALAAAACSKEEAKTAQATAPAAEATAWWKTEPEPGMQKASAKVTGDALPGWDKVNASAAKGKEVFDSNCASCHTFGKGAAAGPDLLGVTHRDTPEWTANFITAPENMVKSDPHAKELMNKYLVQMPNMHLKPEDVQSINAYFRQQDQAGHAK